MKINKDNILKRIEEVIETSEAIVIDYQNESYNVNNVQKSIFGTISILNICYGEDSHQVKSLLSLREKYVKTELAWKFDNAVEIVSLIHGLLSTLKSDISFNLLISLESQAAAEIYGDFITLAKQLIDEGHKDSAVVLACGALEDSLKKYAIANSIDAYDMDLSAVVNSLKAGGLLKGAQAGVVQSYVQLRNKAFHAQFDKIQLPEVSSLVAFVELFLLEKFQ